MRILALVLSLLLAAPLHAQEQCPKQTYTDPAKEPDYSCPSPGEDHLVPKLQLKASTKLLVGDRAPWTGILMDSGRVMVLGLRIEALRRLRWEDTLYCAELAGAQVDYVAQMAQAELELCISQRNNYKSQTKRLQKEVIKAYKWYRSPALWFTAGFVIAAAGTTIIVVAIQD
jgi:hypothetical protein